MNCTRNGAVVERVKTTTLRFLKNPLLSPVKITPLHSALRSAPVLWLWVTVAVMSHESWQIYFRTSRYQNNLAASTVQILLLAGQFWPPVADHWCRGCSPPGWCVSGLPHTCTRTRLSMHTEKIHTFNCRNCVSAVLYSHLRSSVKNLRAIASSFALMSFIIAVIGGSLHSPKWEYHSLLSTKTLYT